MSAREQVRAFGRYLEEFEVGTTYKHWPGKTITEHDDHLFCMITMNHHPLHTDERYARSTQFGRNVVVGNLVYSLALGMSVPDISGKAIANLQVDELKHENPTFHGDTIYAETTSSRSSPRPRSRTVGWSSLRLAHTTRTGSECARSSAGSWSPGGRLRTSRDSGPRIPRGWPRARERTTPAIRARDRDALRPDLLPCAPITRLQGGLR